MSEREFALEVVRRLQAAGYQALWAGGCVRDELLGRTPDDYDVATDARPEDVRRLFPRTIAVGASFGVVEVLGPRQQGKPLKVQVTTFRSEEGYSDGRHPDRVVFSSAREDALRRDFTINGMFYDPIKGELLDYVNGQRDLQQRLLRAIGDPAQRFAEDKLRLLRAARFAARFELTIEPATAAAIRQMAAQITVVSAERIAEELRRLLVDAHRARGVDLLYQLELLPHILPGLERLPGFPHQPAAPQAGDLWQHTLRVLDLLGDMPSFPLAFAALLHDAGKPQVAAPADAPGCRFPGHEQAGARLAQELCQRLKLSNEERQRTVWLVAQHHALDRAAQLRLSQLKPLLAHPWCADLRRLAKADAQASGRSTASVDFCTQLLARWGPEELNPPPLLTGHDLQELGLTPGPHYKELLEQVRAAQLEGTLRTPAEARAWVQQQLQQKAAPTSPAAPAEDLPPKDSRSSDKRSAD